MVLMVRMIRSLADRTFQLWSGKTHTMNALMDRLGEHLFDGDGAVTFSYFELLGKDLTDCLVEEQPEKGVQLSEVDGEVHVTGLSVHAYSGLDLKIVFDTV